EELVSKYQRPEFIDLAIDLYAHVEHFRDAERIGQMVIVPFATILEADHIQRILHAATTNYEIHGAAKTSDILIDLFERTADLRDATKKSWQQFVTKMMEGKDPEDRFAYPTLRGEMEKAGIWPP